jgi:hypothetical protein
MNANQLALVGFSRYLETKTVALAAKKSPAAAKAMTMKVGERLLWSTKKGLHGEVAVERVEQFLELARQETPKGRRAELAKLPVKGATKKGIARTSKASSQSSGGKTRSSAAKKASKTVPKKAGKASTLKKRLKTRPPKDRESQ